MCFVSCGGSFLVTMGGAGPSQATQRDFLSQSVLNAGPQRTLLANSLQKKEMKVVKACARASALSKTHKAFQR